MKVGQNVKDNESILSIENADKNEIDKRAKTDFKKPVCEFIKNNAINIVLILVLYLLVKWDIRSLESKIESNIKELKSDIEDIKSDIEELKYNQDWQVNKLSLAKNATVEISFYFKGAFTFLGHGVIINIRNKTYLFTALHVLDTNSKDILSVGKEFGTTVNMQNHIKIEGEFGFAELIFEKTHYDIILFENNNKIIDLVAVKMLSFIPGAKMSNDIDVAHEVVAYAKHFKRLNYGKVIINNYKSFKIDSLGYSGYSGTPYINKKGEVVGIYSKSEKYDVAEDISDVLESKKTACKESLQKMLNNTNNTVFQETFLNSIAVGGETTKPYCKNCKTSRDRNLFSQQICKIP